MGYATEEQMYKARVTKLSKRIVEADLVNAANAGVFDVAMGFLPEGAILLRSPLLKLTTQFTGGGASAVGVTLGTAGVPTLLATSFDVFGAAASGLFAAMTAGAFIIAPAGGLSIVARFTPDAGHNLTALTAGDCTIEAYFAVPQL